MLAYGFSQLMSGAMYDRVGTRNGFSISALIWGGAISLTSLVGGVRLLAFFRVMLGLGEAAHGREQPSPMLSGSRLKKGLLRKAFLALLLLLATYWYL